jgi:hypothetical protein
MLKRLTLVTLLAASQALAAQTPAILTCYKATKIGTSTLDDATPYTTDTGAGSGSQVQLARATLTVYTDSTYLLEYRFKGKKLSTGAQTSRTRSNTGKVRTVGSDARGPIVGLYQNNTGDAIIYHFNNAGKLQSYDSDLIITWNTHAGSCP